MKSQSVEVVRSRYRSVKMYHRWSDVVSLRVWDQLITESLMHLHLHKDNLFFSIQAFVEIIPSHQQMTEYKSILIKILQR